jgi:hypothetical protein
MRKIVFLLSVLLALSSFITGDPKVKQIPLNAPTTNGHDNLGWNIPADMPDVYYNSELGVITIVDYASVTYYVTIYDDWWNVVITDTKPGGGTINVSSLSSGDYVIEISTSWNHDYEGQFTVP